MRIQLVSPLDQFGRLVVDFRLRILELPSHLQLVTLCIVLHLEALALQVILQTHSDLLLTLEARLLRGLAQVHALVELALHLHHE